VEGAFRAITANGDKSYVTKDEIFQVLSIILQSLSKEQAEYRVRRMKPYKGFDGRTVNGAFNRLQRLHTNTIIFGT
jgi:hypothetical protein